MAKVKSRMDGLSNVLSGKGDLFDQEKYIRPAKPKDFDDEFVRDLYRGTGIASAIIDRPVDRSIRVGWTLRMDDQDVLVKQLKELRFVRHLKKALKYERIYGGALIVFGLNDSGSLEAPLSDGYSKGIDFIRVYRRDQVRKNLLVEDDQSRRFGLPETYEIHATGYDPYKVHYTRCIELEGEPADEDTMLENDGWGDSIFVSTWDCITRYDDTLDTMKRIANNFVNLSIEIDGLFDAIRNGEENHIRKRLAVFNATMHSMNFAIHDKDEKIDKIASNVSGLKDIFQAFADDAKTSSGIPSRVLFGTQLGGIGNTGSGETNDWAEYLEDFINEKVMYIIEDTLKYMTSNDPVVAFNDVITPTAKEKAEIYKLTSEGDEKNVVNSILTPEECRQSHYGGDEFSLDIKIDKKNNDIPFTPQNVKSAKGDKLLEIANNDKLITDDIIETEES